MAERILLRAKVTKVAPEGVYVEVPAFGTGLEYGPLEINTLASVVPGDRVLVGQIMDIQEDFVVLAKIGNTAVAISAEPPTIYEVMAQTDIEAFGEAGNWSTIYTMDDGSWFIGPMPLDILPLADLQVLNDARYYTKTAADTLLAGKSNTGHMHDGAAIISGTVAFARLPTGTTSATVAIGNHTHTYASLTGTPTLAALANNLKTVVIHAAVAGTARPAGAYSVEWIGSVQPTNMTAADTWVNTSL